MLMTISDSNTYFTSKLRNKGNTSITALTTAAVIMEMLSVSVLRLDLCVSNKLHIKYAVPPNSKTTRTCAVI